MNKRTKLLQINSVCNIGSTGRIAEQISQAALLDNYDCYIAYARDFHETCATPIQIGNKLELLYHLIATRLFDRHGLCSKKATHKLIAKIQELQPDIIHLHNIHGYYLNYPILFDYLSQQTIPIIWTQHDAWALTGHCVFFEKCEKWKNACSNCQGKKQYPASWFFDNSQKNHQRKKEVFGLSKNITIVTVSDWAKSVIEKSFFGDKSIKRIYNGIDTQIFYPRTEKEIQCVKEKYGIDNRAVLLAVAYKWDTRKNLLDYIKLNQKIDTKKYVIVLVGLDKKQIKSLPTSMIGIPLLTNQSELATLYTLADVVLNLSQSETFGLTTVEGLACGSPIVAYNVTANKELITKDVGRMVELNDIEAIWQNIQDLATIQDKQNRKKTCTTYARKNFSLQQMTTNYLNLYQELLQK